MSKFVKNVAAALEGCLGKGGFTLAHAHAHAHATDGFVPCVRRAHGDVRYYLLVHDDGPEAG
jgi:hypothetical protein